VIGIPLPVSVMVDTFGTGTVPDAQIESAVQKVFDLTPGGIITTLNLS
jgi:S-adenosylmethionine synthetase